MAAPQPMVQPDFFGVKDDKSYITVYLPQASEEYGPISHYFLVVVPNANSSLLTVRNSEYFQTTQLLKNSKEPESRQQQEARKKGTADMPRAYITAKFLQRSLPYTFPLGDGKSYEGFVNKRLERNVYYYIFVRAYVDTPLKHLYTSSPFSPLLSLEMDPGETL